MSIFALLQPMRKTIHFLIGFLVFSTVFSQKKDTVSGSSIYRLEYELRDLETVVFKSKKEEERFDANKKFIKLWEQALRQKESMDFGFDSIKGVSKLKSDDGKFRIITWNVFKNDGTHAYFGFIQVNNTKIQKQGLFKKTVTNEYELFQLIDVSGSVKSPETYVGSAAKWFGMLYYDKIISCDGYYTLVGWDGNDNLIQKKFIDILYFKSDGTPIFGKDVFKVPKKSPKRIMFQYSSEVAMSLKWNDKRNQIVLSHLAPKDEGSVLEGQYQYYGPDGSFDAYEQHKERWVLQEDNDIRNDKSKNDNVKKPDPRKQKDINKKKK